VHIQITSNKESNLFQKIRLNKDSSVFHRTTHKQRKLIPRIDAITIIKSNTFHGIVKYL
jgi:hypothetical protein